jgi:hypothetical protein
LGEIFVFEVRSRSDAVDVVHGAWRVLTFCATASERASQFLISLLISCALDKKEDCANWAGFNYAALCVVSVNLIMAIKGMQRKGWHRLWTELSKQFH